jgi:hypothetical protein
MAQMALIPRGPQPRGSRRSANFAVSPGVHVDADIGATLHERWQNTYYGQWLGVLSENRHENRGAIAHIEGAARGVIHRLFPGWPIHPARKTPQRKSWPLGEALARVAVRGATPHR